jgi:hypothetical protein
MSESVSVSGLIKTFEGKEREMLLILGEFIDNSIGSAKKDSKSSVDVKIFISEKYNAFYFIDNSSGIEVNNLERVWRFYNAGDAYLKEGLNRGGIGFKQAGFWLGKRVTIYSKNKMQEESCTQLDYDEILARENKIAELMSDTNATNEVWFKNANDEFYKDVFKTLTGDSDTGTLVGIENMKWLIRTFADNILPFQVKPTTPAETGDKGKMNIYQQLYWRYERMIENKDNFKLNLEIIMDNKGGVRSEPIVINAQTVGFKGITFDKETFVNYVQNPSFKFSYIQSFAENETEGQERKKKEKYGITVRDIVSNLKRGNSSIEFYIPFLPNDTKKYDKLKVIFYLLDYKKIDNVFSSLRIMHGVEFVQDGRSINTGIKVNSEILKHIEVKFKKSTGEYDTNKNYWMAQVFLDSDNEDNQNAFEPDDVKNKIKNSANVASIKESLDEAISELYIDMIFNHIIQNLKQKSDIRTEMDKGIDIIVNKDKSDYVYNNNLSEEKKDENVEIAESLWKVLDKKSNKNVIKNIVKEHEGAVLSSTIINKMNFDWKHKICVDRQQVQFLSLKLVKNDYDVYELIYTFNFSRKVWNINTKSQKNDWMVFGQFLVLYLNKMFFASLQKTNDINKSIDDISETIEIMNLVNEEGFN